MPKRVDHEERRQQIAAALLRVLARDGLDAVSLRHVATEAGVTAGMVQHYFPSKDAMMKFAMRAAGDRYERRITRQLSSLGDEPPPARIIRVLVTNLLPADAAEADDARIALAFQAYAANNATAAADLAEGNRAITGHLAELLRSTGAGGRDPQIAAAALVATAEGLAVAVLTARLPGAVATRALDHHLALLLGAGGPVPGLDAAPKEIPPARPIRRPARGTLCVGATRHPAGDGRWAEAGTRWTRRTAVDSKRIDGMGMVGDEGSTPVMLRDGRQVLIRPIRAGDGAALADAFQQLSANSRRLRFGSAPRTLGAAALRHLVDSVDGVDHVAYAAFDDSERLVGVARILRYPDDPDTLDVGMAVADDYQGAGLGHVLGHLLAANRPRPAKRIVTSVAPENEPVMSLFRAFGATATRSGSGIVIELSD